MLRRFKTVFDAKFLMHAARGLVAPSVHHLRDLIRDRRYREYQWLVSQLIDVPRFTEMRIKVRGWDLCMPDSASFLSTWRDLFLNRIYEFPHQGTQPRILDLGANIGLSVLFFKELCPDAQITAFEADPTIFRYLEQNLRNNGYDDAELVNKAAWDENKQLTFFAEGADGGRISLAGEGRKTIEVEAVDIARYLGDRRFDFIKIDIEGAEDRVLPACDELLGDAKWVFVEYHSREGEPQRLGEIISQLTRKGFRVQSKTIKGSDRPFLGPGSIGGFDLQLNLFAFRDAAASPDSIR